MRHCSLCGQAGHYKSTCPGSPPLKVELTGSTVAQDSASSKRACSVCRKPGHRATTCPNKNSAAPSAALPAPAPSVPVSMTSDLGFVQKTWKRACSICHKPGHRAKNCSGAKASPPEKTPSASPPENPDRPRPGDREPIGERKVGGRVIKVKGREWEFMGVTSCDLCEKEEAPVYQPLKEGVLMKTKYLNKKYPILCKGCLSGLGP